MKPEAAGTNGIGPLVREYVHQRNAARKAGEGTPADITAPAPSSADTLQLSAFALARFEAWKAKHSPPAPGVTEPAPDANPSLSVPLTTIDITSSISIHA